MVYFYLGASEDGCSPVITKNVLYQLSYVGADHIILILSSSVYLNLRLWWRGGDSNLRSPSERQIYSLLRLTTPAPLQQHH